MAGTEHFLPLRVLRSQSRAVPDRGTARLCPSPPSAGLAILQDVRAVDIGRGPIQARAVAVVVDHGGVFVVHAGSIDVHRGPGNDVDAAAEPLTRYTLQPAQGR